MEVIVTMRRTWLGSSDLWRKRARARDMSRGATRTDSAKTGHGSENMTFKKLEMSTLKPLIMFLTHAWIRNTEWGNSSKVILTIQLTQTPVTLVQWEMAEISETPSITTKFRVSPTDLRKLRAKSLMIGMSISPWISASTLLGVILTFANHLRNLKASKNYTRMFNASN